MNEQDNLERALARWFEAGAAAPAPADRFQQAIDATRARQPRSAMLAGFGSAWIDPGFVGSAQRLSVPAAVVLALLILALAAGALITGGQPRRLPAVGPAPALGMPAGNGLIALASEGDIFVGDPVSGKSTAIVTGPSDDTRPVFSPDGLRIAFLRVKSETDATLMVVRADGSDQRVAATIDSDEFPTIAWTPDSTSILVEHLRGTSVLLTLVDGSGGAEPRLIGASFAYALDVTATPPLQTAPGAIYMRAHAQVAPMFRPPDGDQIVGVVDGALSVVDLDGAPVEGFVPPLPSGPFNIDGLTWSPDGSIISLTYAAELTATRTQRDPRLYLMNADGSGLRRFETVFINGSWSPDGSTIAFEKPATVSGGAGSVIAMLDIETGTERVLDATAAVEKDVPGPPWDQAFGWLGTKYAYAGWSWTPDGHGIAVLERHGTRPFVVDIETGETTELPWVSESAVSWQRVPLN